VVSNKGKYSSILFNSFFPNKSKSVNGNPSFLAFGTTLVSGDTLFGNGFSFQIRLGMSRPFVFSRSSLGSFNKKRLSKKKLNERFS